MNSDYDDWAICDCDYCGSIELKCYRQDDLKPLDDGTPRYYCDTESCNHMRYVFGIDPELEI